MAHLRFEAKSKMDTFYVNVFADTIRAIMEVDPKYFGERKEKAKMLYISKREIYCPYFQDKVILNADGFHHLQFSARRERSKREQLLKFSLLPLALDAIRKSGTLQEYRKMLAPVGTKASHDHSVPMKEVEYWGFVAILGPKQRRIRVIIRRVGAGNRQFWSVMLHSKMKEGKQKLHDGNMEDEAE